MVELKEKAPQLKWSLEAWRQLQEFKVCTEGFRESKTLSVPWLKYQDWFVTCAVGHDIDWTYEWFTEKTRLFWRSDLKPVREPFCSDSTAKKIKVENAYFEVLLHHDPIKYIHEIMVLPKVTWCTVKVNFSACKYASNLLPQLCRC